MVARYGARAEVLRCGGVFATMRALDAFLYAMNNEGMRCLVAIASGEGHRVIDHLLERDGRVVPLGISCPKLSVTCTRKACGRRFAERQMLIDVPR